MIYVCVYTEKLFVHRAVMWHFAVWLVNMAPQVECKLSEVSLPRLAKCIIELCIEMQWVFTLKRT